MGPARSAFGGEPFLFNGEVPEKTQAARSRGASDYTWCAALVAALFPRAVLVPVIVVQVWFGATLLAQAIRMRRRRAPPAPRGRNGAGRG